jgi:hypothetical protein
MKKIVLLLIAFLFFAISSEAQTFTMTGSADTVVNTATKACSLKTVHSYKQISIQAVITKISGTVGGTLTLLGSIDGTNYINVDTATFVNSGLAATYTATNTTGAQSKVWIINNNPYLWFKLSYTGTGTMSASLKGYLLPREEN